MFRYNAKVFFMSKIYLIQCALVTKENFNNPCWLDCYCVHTEDEARCCCNKEQSHSNMDYIDCSFKFIYRYKALIVF